MAILAHMPWGLGLADQVKGQPAAAGNAGGRARTSWVEARTRLMDSASTDRLCSSPPNSGASLELQSISRNASQIAPTQ